jgi:hypothetical protein
VPENGTRLVYFLGKQANGAAVQVNLLGAG